MYYRRQAEIELTPTIKLKTLQHPSLVPESEQSAFGMQTMDTLTEKLSSQGRLANLLAKPNTPAHDTSVVQTSEEKILAA